MVWQGASCPKLQGRKNSRAGESENGLGENGEDRFQSRLLLSVILRRELGYGPVIVETKRRLEEDAREDAELAGEREGVVLLFHRTFRGGW